MSNFLLKDLRGRKGFTLIEILIVVAIIALLASTVLIGLGTVTQKGRDARRISDLKSIQVGLELYFTKTGSYPPTPANWSDLQATLKGAAIGVSTVPNDPRATATYLYAASADGTTYKLAADLEDASNPALTASTADHSNGLLDCAPAKRYCVSP
jgi:prepilin-type N-terminal cleavage/methylation domain-containing protein